MQIRRCLLGLTALVALMAVPATAQNRGAGMMERQQAMIDTIVVRMELAGEQETAFRAIMDEQIEGMRTIFEEYQGARDPQMRDDMMALQEETDENLGTILSEEEIVLYQTIRDELRAQFRAGRQGPPQG